MKPHIVKGIVRNSIADNLGIEPGDALITINGEKIIDIIDYKFSESGDFINVLIQKHDGEEYLFEIEKDYDEDLGLIFESGIIDKPKHCNNKCIFCFIDQLPDKMRESLYFKDDDYRFSFLQGNFITLTNIKEHEIERIIKYRLSPIYVSVHATDDEVRKKILNNSKAGGILDKLKRLTLYGIKVHCQIVLCPGINDGMILDKSIKDLSDLYPGVKSVAVVPVGLTDYREGLYKLEPYNHDKAVKLIAQVTEWQNKLKEEKGTSFVFIADEFYVLANKEIPEYNHYEGFPHLENGVGLMALFKNQFDTYFKNIKTFKVNSNKYVVITGISAYEFIKGFADKLNKIGFNIEVKSIKNDFFGHGITVSGLVTGEDIINQLKGKIDGKILIIPECMLKAGTDIFLDDMTVAGLEKQLNARVIISEVNGKSFIQKINMGR
jgi:putative radical SAM enzyme (TIGR03279 family)